MKLTKLGDCNSPLHPQNIPAGNTYEGDFVFAPVVGYPFLVANINATEGHVFRTSTVQEILSADTFRTFNSIYRWEIE